MRHQYLQKATGSLLLLALFWPAPAMAQEMASTQRRIDINRIPKQRSLKAALVEVERQYHIFFTFESQLIRDKSVRADLPITGATLDATLAGLLGPNGLNYQRISDKYYSIIADKDQSGSESANRAAMGFASMLPSVGPIQAVEPGRMVLSGLPVQLTDQTITGAVTDERNTGLPGVSVVLKGTSKGTTTDVNGNYSLTVPDGTVVLIFSYVGFLSQEVAAGNRSTLSVKLLPDNKSLNEVVVVGYGTVKKSDLTGAVARVGETEIKATPIPSLDRALQGRAAGVQVVANSAAPGGSSTIRIRGSGSVNASNDPLYVIDGFPTTGLNSINTNDIESIEILKDASATAIYGSRGSNGVVLVTTKRGKAGKTVISYDAYYGIQTIRRKIPLLNASQFANFVDEARVNGGAKPYFDGSSADRPLPLSLGEGTDWQSQIFRPAPIQSHQLAASGGSEKSRYAISFGYYNQQGIILNSDFKRYTLRANLDNNLSSKLKTGLTIQGAYTTGNNAKTDVDGNGGGGVTSSALSYAPNFPLYNADGSYYKNTGALNGFGVDNPLAVANEIKNTTNVIRLLANAYLDYAILDGLNFRTSFGTDLQSSKTKYFATRLALAGATLGGTASLGNEQSVGWLNENTLNYTRQLTARHSLNALLGYTIQGLTTENATANANTFTNDFALYNNLDAGSTLVAPGSGASDWRLISYLARINYGFDDRFVVTLTGRRDGSSRFGANQKFGFFPSGAVAWKLGNEKWLKTLPAVSDAKLRISYGLSGNQEIGNYRYLANISSIPYILGGTLNTGAATGGIANPDLRWEKNAQFDAGLDVGLLNNRVQLTADYYIKTTSDLLFNVSVPTSSGFSTTLKNIGSVQNKGIELSLSTINVDRSRSGQGGFRWTSEFNVTINRNKVLTLDGRQQFTTGADARIYNTAINPILLRVDSPLGNFYGRVVEGIFQNQAEVDASAQKLARPGDLRYKDLNGDGVINDNDRDIIGNASPKIFGGFNNTFSFKGFDLNVFIQGNGGNQILNYSNFDLINLTGGNNQSVRVLDRWTPTNPSNTIPRANGAGGSRILSSAQVEDGSYLRVKNISLGYNLPTGLLSPLTISSAKIYVTAQNWITLTNYTGYDPEVNRYGSSSLSQGLDYGGYPAAKTLLVGLNLKF